LKKKTREQNNYECLSEKILQKEDFLYHGTPVYL